MGKALSDSEWEMLKEKASQYHREGRFVTFQAYEWTSNTHGHRNVYYLEDAPLYGAVLTPGVIHRKSYGIG